MNNVKSHDTDQVMEHQVGTELWALSQKRRSLCIPLPQGGHFLMFQYCNLSLSTAKAEKVRIACN